MAGLDWTEWHRGYDDPGSSLSGRLAVVRTRIGEALDALGPDRRRVLSLCAGDGRDVLPELARRDEVPAEVLLVELNPDLAERGRQRAATLGLQDVEVRTADAGDRAVFEDWLPVDLLLLCGIFGNVVDADIQATLEAVPSIVSPGGFVIWTRGWFESVDLRPAVRRWSLDAGLIEVGYDGEPAQFGVGMYEVPAIGARMPLPSRLFTFVR